MKTLTTSIFTYSLWAIGLLSMNSCSKDSSSPSSTSSAPVQGKWINSDTTSSLRSMEFNKSAMAIIITKAGLAKSYHYKSVNSSSIEITNFGNLENIAITGTSMSGSLTPAGSTAKASLKAQKSPVSVGTAANSSLLYQTWKVN